MTRRGSMAYYLAAWVIGSFVGASAYWWQNSQAPSVSDLLLIYFFALIVGLVDMLVFAFLLRRAMRWAGTNNIFVWAVTGSALYFVLLGVLNALAEKQPYDWQTGPAHLLASLVFSAPASLRVSTFWPVPLEGAVIGAVLCLVDRPFEIPPPEAAPAQPSAPRATYTEPIRFDPPVSAPQPPAPELPPAPESLPQLPQAHDLVSENVSPGDRKEEQSAERKNPTPAADWDGEKDSPEKPS